MKYALLIFFSALFALVVGELGARFWLPPPRQIVAYDPSLGWKYVANASIPLGGGGKIETNSDGFRSREFAEGRDAYRILVLGDSYAAAISLPEEQIFPRLLEKQLNENGFSQRVGKRVSVFNAGVSAWSTDQQLLFWRKYGSQWKPDLVLLFVVPNDVREAYAKQIFTLNNSGQAELHDMPRALALRHRLWWTLLNHSAFAQGLAAWLRASDIFPVLRNYFPFYFNLDGHSVTDLDLFLKKPPAGLLPAWQLFDSLLGTLAAEVKGAGVPLLVGVVPTRAEVEYPLAVSPQHEPGLVGGRVKKLGGTLGFAYMDLVTRVLADREGSPRFYFSHEFHLNERGHVYLAGQVAKFVDSWFTDRGAFTKR